MSAPVRLPVKGQVIDLSGKHILIAEDEPINMMVTIKMLQARNAVISKASNGNEAIELLKNGLKPDLILLDIHMPELDGFMAIEKIKEVSPHVIVLAYTASFMDEDIERQLQEKGFDGCLPKSFKPEAFYTTIFNALKANR